MPQYLHPVTLALQKPTHISDRHRGLRAMLVVALAAVTVVQAAWASPEFDVEMTQAVPGVLERGELPLLRRACLAEFTSAVRQVYSERSHRSLWSVDGVPTRQAAAVVDTLGRAQEHGLVAADYGVAELASEFASLRGSVGTAEARARFDVSLSMATACFAMDLHRGRVRPQALGMDLRHERDDLDVAALLPALAESADAAGQLAEVAPHSEMYRGLVEGLRRYRELSEGGVGVAASSIPKLRPGDSADGVSILRAHLQALGDTRSEAVARPGVYDEDLVAAVRRFQRRHGLDDDGVVGKRTRAALGVPLAERVRQIELALERLRWLPDLDRRLLLVNIPEFRLRVFGPDTPGPALEMKVVVGSAANDTETAVFSTVLQYLIFRPYWYVPYSIASEEMLPRQLEDPDHLSRKRIDVVGDQVLSEVALASGAVYLRQQPGPGNSLGLVKFIFPNPNKIYMHDTPEKKLFMRSRRDFSHGCIRLEDPVALATLLLGEQGWDRARVLAAMQGRDSVRVDLDPPVPVVISYLTAAAESDGRIHFFDDIYGRDPILSDVLNAGRKR